MKPSAVAHRPGPRPKLPRPRTCARHRRPSPSRDVRARSGRPSSAGPSACPESSKQKNGRHKKSPQTRAAVEELLCRGCTSGAPPPQARRWHRSGVTSRRGRARKDLFLFRAAAVASATRTGHWNLDNLRKLGLHPSASRRSMVFPTARQPEGHRQRRRPRKSPADGTALSVASLDCSRLERKGEASSFKALATNQPPQSPKRQRAPNRRRRRLRNPLAQRPRIAVAGSEEKDHPSSSSLPARPPARRPP
ncbi:unnamed protein product [Urochloa humidicola]